MIHKWSIFNSYATLPEAKSSLCGFIHVLFRNAWANYHVLCTHSVGLLGGSNVRLRTQLNQQSAAKRIFPLFPQARWKWKVALKMAQRCFPFLYYTMVYRRCLMWTGEGMKKKPLIHGSSQLGRSRNKTSGMKRLVTDKGMFVPAPYVPWSHF